MNDRKPPPSLDDLDAKLQKAKARRHVPQEGPDQASIGAGLGFALRLGIELVAALAVGVGIGWLLDYWLETSPLMLVVFFFLGSAAGFLNVYRAVSGYGYAAGYNLSGDDQSSATSSQEEPPSQDGKGSG
ncbi:MAG: AtpZ/AtpI family protein [Alphaproteobacteria bacterium]|nr:AtpZ/AtpI family protein [Alphaproteobacteria bacterium]